MKRFFLVAFLVTLFVPTLFAQTRTPVQLPDKLSSGWGKPVRYTITKPNILQVRGTAADMDGTFLRDLKYDGQKQLVVKIRAMSGRFPWDKGKMFGITMGNPSNRDDKWLIPEGRVVLDRMIDGPFAVGDEVVMNLPAEIVGKSAPLTLGLSTFCGATFELEFYFQD